MENWVTYRLRSSASTKGFVWFNNSDISVYAIKLNITKQLHLTCDLIIMDVKGHVLPIYDYVLPKSEVVFKRIPFVNPKYAKRIWNDTKLPFEIKFQKLQKIKPPIEKKKNESKPRTGWPKNMPALTVVRKCK